MLGLDHSHDCLLSGLEEKNQDQPKDFRASPSSYNGPFKNDSIKGCFYQCGDPCTEEGDVCVSDVLKHAPDQWNNFKDQALLWRGFDRFEEVYGPVDTEESDNNDVVLSEGEEE